MFNDEGEGKQTTGKERKGERKPNTEEDKNMHPSWAAKQKQKLQILPFKGKKTVFDD